MPTCHRFRFFALTSSQKSPDIMNPGKLKKVYASVHINSSTYFENVISMIGRDIAEEWSSLGKPVDRDQWDMTVPTVNAYYNPPGNEIVFPAGIMQFPVFDVNVPQYLSYGAFGSVSGHELSHAFDSTGRHYDQNGNFTDWVCLLRNSCRTDWCFSFPASSHHMLWTLTTK